jgi:small nuclear ribonucleoprotein (snRNP)-like protein
VQPDRWDQLFEDLEARAGEYEAADFDAEVAERARGGVGQVRLVDRLRGAIAHPVEVRVMHGVVLRGRLDAIGADWLLLAEEAGRAALVPLTAVLSVAGLGAQSAAPGSEGRVGARLDLRYALRGLARERNQVQVVLADGSTVAGTIDRVGADFVEIAEHAQGEPRRAAAVRRVRTVPLGGLAAVRSW